MDVSRSDGPGMAGLQGAPSAPAPDAPIKSDESKMGIGERLNRLSGVETEKNLYAPKQEMGKDAFLKMFMEQLKYQDPMNPVKNDQFSQQMAMFSQLEQQVNTNKNLEKMISQGNNMQIAALQLVGKNITADRSTLYHDKSKATGMTFKVPQDVSELKLEIIDGMGEVVKTFALGPHNQGDVSWKWDGNKENGAPAESGKYNYRVTGKGPDGADMKINTKVDGRVSGVTSSNGIVYLMVGEQKIGLNDVEMIKEAEAKTDAGTPGGVPGAPPLFGAQQALPTASAALPANLAALQKASDGNPAIPTKIPSGPAFEEDDGSGPEPALRQRFANSDGNVTGINRETASSESPESRGTNMDSSKRDDNALEGRMNPLMPLYSR